MSPRLLLHIGSDKAGSTALQSFLVGRLDWLSDRGVHVVRTGFTSSGHHRRLLESIAEPRRVAQLAVEVSGLPASVHTIVVSWEGLHRYRERPRNQLKEVVGQVLPDASVTLLYYVRNQIDAIQSGILQRVKQRRLPAEVVVDLQRPLFEMSPDRRSLLVSEGRLFHGRLEAWRATLGNVEVHARLYDRQRLRNGDIVADFIDVLGLSAHDDPERVVTAPNPSLSAEAALVLARMTRAGASDAQLEAATRALLDAAAPKGRIDFLREDARRLIHHFYAPDNARLIAEFPHCEGILESRTNARADLLDLDLTPWIAFVERMGVDLP